MKAMFLAMALALGGCAAAFDPAAPEVAAADGSVTWRQGGCPADYPRAEWRTSGGAYVPRCFPAR